MNRLSTILFLQALSMFAFSCQTQQTPLTDAEKAAIADSAKAVVQTIFANANSLDFEAALRVYSDDADARYIENGVAYASLSEMKKAYADLKPGLELMHNIIDNWNIMVLGRDVASISLPLHFSVKAKGRPQYNGQYYWSGIVQRRHGTWLLVQSHESWINAEQVAAAMTPSTAKH